MNHIYSFSAKTNQGEEQSLADFKDKVLLIVNTASKCGFTPQLKELQSLYEQYHSEGLEILAFPSNQFMNQEPGTNEQIRDFCVSQYGVTFPLFAKVDVKGAHSHPLFQYLTKEASGIFTDEIKWNFTKFLINRQGEVMNRFAPTTSSSKIEKEIQRLL